MDEWDEVWAELRDNLSCQPWCPQHPEFPCVRTLGQGAVVNDILRVDPHGIQVRSHRTSNPDVIPASSFRAWWDHLQQYETAALDPNDANCPRSDRAVLVGAILACCLRDRVEYREGGQIRLRPGCPLPDEVPAGAPLIEGASRTVMVNAYERNPVARARCISHYGPTCRVCGFNFRAVYGPLAEGFIHVHHLISLSEIGEEYEVDPIADLRPVCPNCHAIIHLDGGCRSIENARSLVDPRVLAFWASFVEPAAGENRIS